MSLFGKSLREYAIMVRTGIILIVLMGLLRLIVGASGVPYERATHFVSMTILTFLLCLFYGQRVVARGLGTYRHLFPMVLMLSLAMYGFVIVAILIEGVTGIHGYFHAPGRGLAPTGMNVATHIGGQLLAMLFFIPLAWILASVGFFLSRSLRPLR